MVVGVIVICFVGWGARRSYLIYAETLLLHEQTVLVNQITTWLLKVMQGDTIPRVRRRSLRRILNKAKILHGQVVFSDYEHDNTHLLKALVNIIRITEVEIAKTKGAESDTTPTV